MYHTELYIRTRTYHFVQRRWIDIADVVEQVSIGTQLADDHDGRIARVLRYADAKLQTMIRIKDEDHERCTYESNDIGMIEITQ